MAVYGYCRISTRKQSIERQIRNILEYDPQAVIVTEAYTGTKFEGRKEWQKLLTHVKSGDTIVFDSVSRMSRNAAEGVECYEQLHAMGVKLVFLKEHHIDTEVYDMAQNVIPMTETSVDVILRAINDYLVSLRKEQITLAFKQSEKEVEDLRQRTKEGLVTARLNGKQVGQTTGARYNVKKADSIKKAIKKYNRDFDGSLTDGETMQMLKVARNTYYKYKREMKEV